MGLVKADKRVDSSSIVIEYYIAIQISKVNYI